MIGRIGLARRFSTAKFTVQPAIERSPTDLLNALSETVGPDTTAPHFAFIDDPITIPSTQSAKRTYFMAKEFGKRAARELATEWPTLFAFDRDLPRLPAFRPENLPDPLKIEPTEENLLKMMGSREVLDAVMLYERIRSDGQEISEKTQLELFKLTAYYNSSKIPFSEWAELPAMRNFGESSESSWKVGGVADLLFETVPKTDETVSIMIASLCKFGETQKAKQLFKTHKSSNGKFHREALDALIATSNYEFARQLADEMSSKFKIQPSISTFNALLQSAIRIPKFEERIKIFAEIIGEMRELAVLPALSSYQIIVKNVIDQKLVEKRESEESKAIYEKQLGVAISWIQEILNDLEKYQNQDKPRPFSSKCHLFFADTMGIIYRGANLKLAEQLKNIYESPKNQIKMPEFTVESIFYNRYLQLAIEQTGALQKIYELYKSMVPRLVGVNNSLSSLIFRKLHKEQHWPLLRRIITDGVAGGQINGVLGEEMRRQLSNVQLHTLNTTEREQYTQLVQKLVAVWIEFSKFADNLKRMQRKLTQSQISECALLLTRIGEHQKANELLELLLDESATQGDEATVSARGHARPWAMAELFEDALRRKDALGAATCLQIMGGTMNRSRLEPLANRIVERCSVSTEQQRIIQAFVRLRPE